MKNLIVVPSLGESVVEARIAHWLKNEGDKIENGEVLIELETEKVNVDITAQSSGVLTKIMAHEEDTVHIGDVIGEIEAEAAVENEKQEAEEARKLEKEKSVRIESKQVNNIESAINQKLEVKELERATPVAKRVAEGRGLKISDVAASGTGGRITKHDVESFLAQRDPSGTDRLAKPQNGDRMPEAENRATKSSVPYPASSLRTEERVRMSLRRKTIARRMLEAQQTTAMLTTFNEIDMSRVMELRRKYKDQFNERYGIGLGIVSFFVKASIASLKEFPRLNAEIDGDEIVYKRYYDIGVAIAAEEGLVVPVLRNADGMSFAEIEAGIKNFSEKSKNGTLTLEDLRGGTFTITNGGVFGSLMSTPILNPPQVGILGLHKITDRPVVENGQVVVRPMMYVALTYNHRIVDGSESVQFLVRVKELVEDPAAMVLE
ncbi:MAG: 2-oxoglutarate dehydrogenase complex dihydrolipoyllysine-residue succinyltransferase [Candidatus Kryptoniota bacterium]